MDEWIEVFKAGTHTDNNGIENSFSENDLDTIVAKYNNQKEHEAPIVVGHPKLNTPAYGWIESLKRVGKILYAKPKQVAVEFAEAVKEGRYKKRSISLYDNLLLKHVGFLGGAAPAVKGLKDIEFNSEEESKTYNYSEGTKMEEELKKLQEQLAQKEAEINQLKDENKTLLEKISTYEKDTASKEEKSFCEKLVSEGKMLPGEVEANQTVLLNLRSTKDFSEEGSDYKKFKQVLSDRPKVMNFGETITNPAKEEKKENKSAHQIVADEIKAAMEKK